MATKIFISKGSAASDEQRAFVDAVLEMLQAADLSPRIMNENEWSYEQPLRAIKKIIQECEGIVVIAFSRTVFEEGVEVRKGALNPLTDIRLPTPWNHIEAAIAYAFDLPLLVVAEKGLKPEGLIEDGYDWRIYWTELNPDVVKSDSFRGFLRSWKEAVEQYKINQASRQALILKPDELTIGTLIKAMSVPQLWQTVAAILAVIFFIATASYRLGAGIWPWQQPTSGTSPQPTATP